VRSIVEVFSQLQHAVLHEGEAVQTKAEQVVQELLQVLF
jgi:hypothetical protein